MKFSIACKDQRCNYLNKVLNPGGTGELPECPEGANPGLLFTEQERQKDERAKRKRCLEVTYSVKRSIWMILHISNWIYVLIFGAMMTGSNGYAFLKFSKGLWLLGSWFGNRPVESSLIFYAHAERAFWASMANKYYVHQQLFFQPIEILLQCFKICVHGYWLGKRNVHFPQGAVFVIIWTNFWSFFTS